MSTSDMFSHLKTVYKYKMDRNMIVFTIVSGSKNQNNIPIEPMMTNLPLEMTEEMDFGSVKAQ